MAHEDLKGLDDRELINELERVNLELGQLRARVPSKWKVIRMSAGALIGVVGVILAPPTGGASIALTAVGFGVMAVDGIEMVGDIRGDQETRARIDHLQVRNAAVHSLLNRRRTGRRGS
jgi:hypothetical protein